MTQTFQLSYDYLCPFANIVHQHVLTALGAGADYDVTFVPWTLHQVHRDEGAPDVWDDPAQDAGLLALAASVSVRDEQPELFLSSHGALFSARHVQSVRLNTIEEVDGVLEPLGVDLGRVHADIASRRPHQVIAESFRDFERYAAFGVPTFVVGEEATFVRYMVPPSEDAQASIKIVDSLLSLVTGEPELNEFKRTKIPH